MANLLRGTVATLAGLAFRRGVNLWGPAAFDLNAYDSEAFDTFDGGAIVETGSARATNDGLTFTRTTELQ